jgi:hypothetical protein
VALIWGEQAEQEGDEDDEVVQDKVEWEQDLMLSVQDAHGWVLRLAGEAAVPPFQAVMEPLAAPLLDPQNGLELRLLALCLYLHVLEFGGRLGANLAAALVGPVLEVSSHGAPTLLSVINSPRHCLHLPQLLREEEDDDARQTAAYGVGILAQFGGPAFQPAALNEALPLLLAVLTKGRGQSQDEAEDGTVRDNAASSVLRVCRYRGNWFESQRLLDMALAPPSPWLPLRDDIQEAHSTHAHLVQWLEADDHAALTGPNGERLPAILTLLAALMGT